MGVILRSRGRRRISQVIDSLQGEILRFAQNDIARDGESELHARQSGQAWAGEFSRSMAVVELQVLLSERLVHFEHGQASLISCSALAERRANALRQPAMAAGLIELPASLRG